jgi:hypothetical protein
MALQASGNPIKYSQIAGEFGYPSYKNLNNSLGVYRVSETYGTLTNLALDNNINGATITAAIPQSGAIKFSDFYSKRLNRVIDYYSVQDFSATKTTTTTTGQTVAIGKTTIFLTSVSDVAIGSSISITGKLSNVPIVGVGNTYVQIGTASTITSTITGGLAVTLIGLSVFSRTTAGTQFNAYLKYASANPQNNFYSNVGGFKPIFPVPVPDPGGKQVFISVNGTIGSKPGSDLYVALTTGKDWDSTTRIHIDVGSSGRITGSGGNGGGGGNPGGSGLPGSSALGIEHTGTTTLVNRGYVICGYGGGGGGAYSSATTGGKSPASYSAGGGGGGGGAGLPAGSGGSGQTGTNSSGTDGGSGTLTVGGAGGGGGSNGPAAGSAGGKGGDINSAAVTASGVGGAAGYAILKASTIGSFNYINTGGGVSAGSTTAVGTPQ